MNQFAMTFSIMAAEGQPLFHDFLGMSPNEPKHTKGSVSRISSNTVPSSSRGFKEDLNRVLPTKASLPTSEWPDMPCSTPPLLKGPFSLTAPSTSDPISESLSWASGVGLLACRDKSAFYRPEVDNRPLGKKRDSNSNRNNLLQDRLQISVDTLENSRGSKISRLELKDEKRGRLFDIPTTLDDLPSPMQPPRQTSSCSTLLQSSMHKPDFMALNKFELPASLNMTAYGHSHLSPYGGLPDRNYSNASGDNTSMPPSLPRPPADEGSRTGLQMSGLANLINSVPSSVSDRSTGAPGVSVGGTKFSSPSAGSDSSIPKSHHIAASGSRQLTVFYGGQAHVFDDVPNDKADAIMALAGSNGRSWSTTYSPRRKSADLDGLVPVVERKKNNEEEVRNVRRGL